MMKATVLSVLELPGRSETNCATSAVVVCSEVHGFAVVCFDGQEVRTEAGA